MSRAAYKQEPVPKQDTREEERAKKSKKDSSEDKAAREKSKDEARHGESSRKQEQTRRERTTPSSGRQASQEHARPAANAHYHFRSEDRSKLRQHFQAQLANVNRANRPHIAAGTSLETTYQTVIVPVPQEVIVYLAPPPPGYLFGFLDGYVIVYDPSTFFVVDVIDLL